MPNHIKHLYDQLKNVCHERGSNPRPPSQHPTPNGSSSKYETKTIFFLICQILSRLIASSSSRVRSITRHLHGVLAAAALSALHEVASHGQYGLDALRVGRQLSLESLVLLMLRLYVRWVLHYTKHLLNVEETLIECMWETIIRHIRKYTVLYRLVIVTQCTI